MNRNEYIAQRIRREQEGAQERDYCLTCLRPRSTCYCHLIQRFDPRMRFAILIHPIEVRRHIATGRLAHLSLEHSRLIRGHEFATHPEVNALIADPRYHSIILYPGPEAIDIGTLTNDERMTLVPSGKTLLIFVLDGTWSTAKAMMRLSPQLMALPRIAFVPPSPSNFRVRHQPRPECYSTIEAIHHTIELLGPSQGFDTQARQHDALLSAFRGMVDEHLERIPQILSMRERD